jgi:hypothetical protein
MIMAEKSVLLILITLRTMCLVLHFYYVIYHIKWFMFNLVTVLLHIWKVSC